MPKAEFIRFSFIAVSLVAVAACSDTAGDTHPKGIDVSHFQGDVDWEALQKEGVAFTYIKASEGLTITDPFLSQNWAGAKEERIMRGGYHVFSAGDDGEKQADQFLLSLKTDKIDYNGALPPVLDIEAIPDERLSCAKPEVKKWLKRVESVLGCKPIIYTSPATWDEEFPGSFAGYDLWLADYSDTPQLPKGWQDWTFWQHSNEGRYAGIEGSVDLDRFNGDLTDLSHTRCVNW